MDTVLLFLHIRGLPLLVFYFHVEEKFAGGKFREIPCAVDNYFAGGKFRAKSKFANIAKISSTRKIRVIQYTLRLNTSSSLAPTSYMTSFIKLKYLLFGQSVFFIGQLHFQPISADMISIPTFRVTVWGHSSVT